jgi:heptosyltransferase-2
MKNITIIKLGAIGDVIQTAAAVYEYKRLHPGLRVDWVIGNSLTPLLHSMKVADQIISIHDQFILSGTLMKRISALLKACCQIFCQIKCCDQLYIAHTNLQYCAFGLPILLKNPGLILGHIKRFFPLLTHFRVTEYFHFLSNDSITGRQGNEALQKIGKNVLDARFSHQFVPDPSKKYVALVPGGSKNGMRDDFLRRWPIENYVQLSCQLIAKGYTVVLVGGKRDLWTQPYFSELTVIDLIGQTSIIDVVDIFSKANLVISHDTGPLHLATMTASPLITIFGPTPSSAVVSSERKSLIEFMATPNVTCAPCYDGINFALCQNPICMQSTTVDKVFKKATELLSEDILGAQ